MWNHLRSRTILGLALASGLVTLGCGDDNQTPATADVPAPIQSPVPVPSANPTPAPPPTPGNNPGEEVVFVGKIKAIDPPLLAVSSGHDVLTDDQTTYERNGQAVTLSSLQVQEVIRVKGTILDEQKTVLASKIIVLPPAAR